MLDISNCVQEDARTGSPTKIVPKWVVEEIIEKLHIVTVIETAEVLKYESGVYVKNGMQLVEQTIARDLSGLMDGKGNPMYNRKVKAEILDLLKNKTYVHQDDFDVDLDIINMKNGLFNWRTETLVEHTPLYLSKIQIPISYDPDATCELIEEVLREVIAPDDYIKCQEFIAHIFYRNYSIQKCFIILGPGGTGKSAFLNMINHMVGPENCCAVPFSEIDRLFSRVSLCNKLLNECGELDNAAIKRTLIFKALVSGLDPVEAEKKYCDAFRFVNYSKLLFATNSLPKVMDETDGFYRRVELLLFTRKFAASEYKQERMDALVDPSQLAGFFLKCIRRLAALLERHDYTNACDIDDIRDRYRANSDPIQAFADDNLVPCPDGRISCDSTYERYVDFCKKFKVKPVHSNAFALKLPTMIRSMRQDSMIIGKRKVCAWMGVKFVE